MSSETKRINWNSDESVVRAAVPDVVLGSCAQHGLEVVSPSTDMREFFAYGKTFEEIWRKARLQSSVAALDEAHRKVVERWPDARYDPTTRAILVGDENQIGYTWKSFMSLSDSSPSEAPAWIAAAAKLQSGPDRNVPAPREEEDAKAEVNECDDGDFMVYIPCGKEIARCHELSDANWICEKWNACSAAPVVEEAPDRKVTWRVEADEKEWDFDLQGNAEAAYALASINHHRGEYERVALIKLTEEVIEVRTKESADAS